VVDDPGLGGKVEGVPGLKRVSREGEIAPMSVGEKKGLRATSLSVAV